MKQTMRFCDKQVNGKPCGEPAEAHVLTVDGQKWEMDLCPKHSPLKEWQKYGAAPDLGPKRKTIETAKRPWMPDR